MYCIKCGVELEDGAKRCPLCETPVPEIKGLEEKKFVKEYPMININLYEMKMKKVKKAIFLSFFTISIISILEVLFQNLIMYGKLEWGYYAIPSILIFDLGLFVFLDSYRMRTNLFLLLSGFTSYFLLLDFGDKKLTWSIKRGIPIVIALYLISLVFSYVWDKHKSDRLKILNFFIFFVGIFLLILELIISKKMTWSIFSSIPLFILSIMLRYAYKSY
ncbi:MAG: zinc ribbon domain-containing protein, partial [Leptotrichia hongkongensis]